jgi:predicted NUDIX family phosphoesterase
MQREISEEISMSHDISKFFPLGYINNDPIAIGKVHFVILYAVEAM